MNPTAPTIQNTKIPLFTINLITLKNNKHFLTPINKTIRNLITVNTKTTIKQATPRTIVTNTNKINPNYTNEPIYNNANNNYNFDASNNLYIQQYLTNIKNLTTMQLQKNNNYPNTQISITNTLFNNQILTHLTHFMKTKITNSQSNTTNILITILDHNQISMTKNTRIKIKTQITTNLSSLTITNSSQTGSNPNSKIRTSVTLQ